MKRLSKKLLYTLGVTLICGGMQLHAQSLDQAKKLYNDGKYAEAKPVFEKLVKQAPSNASYNQWYGVCCFETGDLAGAEKHLKVAVKRRVQDAYRYLGEVYYQTYRFNEAEEMFDEYITLLTKKKQDVEPYQIRMDLANKASRMLDKVENVQIIDSLVVDKDDFLSAYTLSEESGTLTTYQDFFQTNDPGNSSVYMNQKGDKIYYAHSTDGNHNCLFTQSKLMDQWGDEKQLPMNINSDADDGYPFVLSDGVTIYYASKGNGSLGGYDLFVTRYNINSDTYLTPEQLGMPYNSPFNDYMMVIDEAKRARASIASIKDSWKPGSNYEELIHLAHTEIPYGRIEIKKDFTFPIHNDIVYYTLDDIQSPEAKNYYEKVVSIHKQIKELNEKLESLRASYIKGNKAKREQLKPTILDAEEKLNNLLGQPDEWEKKARNAEIVYLRNNHK